LVNVVGNDEGQFVLVAFVSSTAENQRLKVSALTCVERSGQFLHRALQLSSIPLVNTQKAFLRERPEESVDKGPENMKISLSRKAKNDRVPLAKSPFSEGK